MKYYFFLLLFISSKIIIAQLPTTFVVGEQPATPDYEQTSAWVALPFHKDMADVIPNSETWVSDSLKKVDVFFIYPTLYSRKNATTWTASMTDKKVNRKVANQTIRYQASVFNKSARIYAPIYRQAHLDVFDNEKPLRYEVLDFAYEDVKNAFEYYLKNYNKGRPIIIASHSQGTVLARRLLKEYFDNKEMKEKLVCAYMVGFGIYPKDYKILSLCEDASETNCFVTWSSFKKGFDYPIADGDYLVGEVSVNPISWKIDTASYTSKKGILLSVKGKTRYETTARLKDNMLWVDTKTPFVKSWKIMHMIDYNLFWHNIRENVAERVENYFNKQKAK